MLNEVICSRKERLNKSHQERKKKQSEVVMQRRIGTFRLQLSALVAFA